LLFSFFQEHGKMKTSELTGAALDWAVIKCERPHLHPEGTQHVIPNYSTNWAQGGPIIEREWKNISAVALRWCISDEAFHEGGPLLQFWMRCYVASKLGDEVEIPEELK
jgi:hypothetical protein